MKNDRILSMLGLAMRAGKVVSGEFSVEKRIQKREAWLVLVASDASDNTKKLFRNKCDFYHIPCYIYAGKEALGHAIGKGARASIAILDKGFAEVIQKRLKE